MIFKKFYILSTLAVLMIAARTQAAVIPVVEDVMTSSFFQGTNTVRGYAGDNRPTFRVSTLNPFGTVGAETIYLTFDPAQFAAYSGPVPSALLTLQSIAGGFSADASAGSPFTVSVHAVSVDPLLSVTDDTNPGGPINWLTFYNSNILAADGVASTVIDDFGPATFDVTAVVNSWIAGTNTVFALALTGKNHVAGGEFLHGFANNTEAPGSTFITIVPEPTALVLGLVGFIAVFAGGNRRRRVAL
jgi:hypothetical protein